MSKKPSKLEQRLRLGRHSLFGPKTSSLPAVDTVDKSARVDKKPVDSVDTVDKRKAYQREWMRAKRAKKVK